MNISLVLSSPQTGENAWSTQRAELHKRSVFNANSLVYPAVVCKTACQQHPYQCYTYKVAVGISTTDRESPVCVGMTVMSVVLRRGWSRPVRRYHGTTKNRFRSSNLE